MTVYVKYKYLMTMKPGAIKDLVFPEDKRAEGYLWRVIKVYGRTSSWLDASFSDSVAPTTELELPP